jgi:hypothetical protein
MGSPIDTWDGLTGAYYMGMNSGWELIWLLVSIVMCVVALYVGAKHELDAYKAAERNEPPSDLPMP